VSASEPPEDPTSPGDSQDSKSPDSASSSPETKAEPPKPVAAAQGPAPSSVADGLQKKPSDASNDETFDASKPPSPPKNPPPPSVILIDASKPSAKAPTEEIVSTPASDVIDASRPSSKTPKEVVVDVESEKRKDYVRLIVTIGLLLMLLIVIFWACIESASWPDHWDQTKEMLQIIFPALTGLIGSVLGFYFGASTKNSREG
jgi:hypothetical protein